MGTRIIAISMTFVDDTSHVWGNLHMWDLHVQYVIYTCAGPTRTVCFMDAHSPAQEQARTGAL